MCFLVKYARKSDGKICTDLFGMIRLEPTRLSADSIFLQLRGFFLGKKSKKTKWLGAHQCIARLFDQWSALEQFFVIASAEDRQVAPDKILLEMRHPFTKAYLRFFKYAFNDFNYFNALFQSAKIVIGDMQSECEKFIKTLCSKFIKERFRLTLQRSIHQTQVISDH